MIADSWSEESKIAWCMSGGITNDVISVTAVGGSCLRTSV